MIAADQAAQNAEAATTNTPGMCFSRVSDYYGRPTPTGPGAGHYGGYAIALWTYSTRKHPGDRNPPRGALLLYGALTQPRWPGDENYAAGDVTIAIAPGGIQRATDYPTNGHIGTCTIPEREQQTGRTYLGWIGDIMGNEIDFSDVSSTSSAHPITQGDTDMDSCFYIQSSGAGSKYLFSRPRGIIVREIPKKEWDFLRAVETTAGGIPIELVTISPAWLAKAQALGK